MKFRMKKPLIKNDAFLKSKLGLVGVGDDNSDKLVTRKVSGPAKCEILALLLYLWYLSKGANLKIM